MPSLSGEGGGGPLVEVLLAMNKKVVGKARQAMVRDLQYVGLNSCPVEPHLPNIFQMYSRYILDIF